MAFPCFDGVYLPKQENNFLHHVLDELETYQQKNSHNSVLLFPPLPSRLRYLIHKTIEDLPELTTFSVGESWCRRVVVCPCELRFVGQNLVCMSYASARERLSLRNSQGSTAGSESLSSACVDRSSVNSLSDSCTCPESTENTKLSLSKQESFPSVADRVPKLSADSSAMCPQEEEKLVLRLDEDEAPVLEQTQSQFAELTVEEDEKEKDDTASVSRSLQTEDTSTDKDGVTAEVISVAIEHVHNDYSMYENVSIDSDDFRHVIEIYDFPVMFKTDDLLDFIQPVKERPRTDCAVARRMVTRALGVPTSTTGERANNNDRLGFRFPQLTCWKYFYATEALVAFRAFHFIENIMLSHIHPCIQNKNRQQPTSILLT
uniref:R3H domain and coiled-coil containing 1 n=1 Tax=Neolamprologus brichardi TaxID=32507 RepID=A0A3Q4HFN7_NEOBR